MFKIDILYIHKILGGGAMKNSTCCFFGHREIDEREELREWVKNTVEMLIIEEGVDTFLFGSKSRFDSLCHEVVTELKSKHPHIKRIYVRAEYPVISDEFRSYLLKGYEDTYYPESVAGANRAAYIKRNREMIDKSLFCVVYYDKEYALKGKRSGTKTALEYAKKKKRTIYGVEIALPSGETPLK